MFGNPRQVDEYKHFSEELDSETSRLILKQLTDKVKITEVDEKMLLRCVLPSAKETADGSMHQQLSKNCAIFTAIDKDFDRIRRSGIIEVWSIGVAIRRLLRDE